MFSLKQDPFWESPVNEDARIARIKNGIKKQLKDPKSLVFVVAKSWNDNVVLYEYGGTKFVNVAWLSLESEDMERHIKMGNESLRSTLTPAENLLFGCDVEIVEGDRYILHINQELLSSRVFELVLDSRGDPAVLGTVNGVLCRMEHAYVQMKKGSIPQADYMHLYGRRVSDGKTIEKEKIINT